MIIPLWPSSVVLVPGSRSEGGYCVIYLSQAGLACQDVLNSCKETYFWKSVASLGVSSHSPLQKLPWNACWPMDTHVNLSKQLLEDQAAQRSVAYSQKCFANLTDYPFHTHGMPRQSHKASASLLHKSISHNTNCT